LFIPGLDKAEEKLGNRYDLVLLAAKRAKQLLQEEARPLIRTQSTHPLTIALEEIAAGVYPPPKEETPEGAAGDADLDLSLPAVADEEVYTSRYDPNIPAFLRPSDSDIPEGAAVTAEIGDGEDADSEADEE
jgi:DNA-directed RNA polymerase subunit omega